jgi:hypothetical protein
MHQNAFNPVVIQKLSAMIAGKSHEIGVLLVIDYFSLQFLVYRILN